MRSCIGAILNNEFRVLCVFLCERELIGKIMCDVMRLVQTAAIIVMPQ